MRPKSRAQGSTPTGHSGCQDGDGGGGEDQGKHGAFGIRERSRAAKANSSCGLMCAGFSPRHTGYLHSISRGP